MERWAALLAWLEGSALGNVIRDSGVWTYAVTNLAHILGIATLFGAVLALDLRLLGWRGNTSLAAVATITVPLSVLGFALAVVSGVCMLSTNGSQYAQNPFLPIKFAAIGCALVNTLVASRTAGWQSKGFGMLDRRKRRRLALCGGLSLLCWLAAIAAGRLIGYW
jgi:hypothetical protein